jgi:hypothetical protein
MRVLSAEYVGAVIDMALKSLAALLDKSLPLGVARTSRDWWGIIAHQLRSLVFSKENQDAYDILAAKRSNGGQRERVQDVGGNHQPKSAWTAPAASPRAVVVAPTDELCYAAARNHYNQPAGAPPCSSKGCSRIHPDRYKGFSAAAMVEQLRAAKGGDFGDLIAHIRGDVTSFRV